MSKRLVLLLMMAEACLAFGVPPPSVTAVNPVTGPLTGGTSVIITGAGFYNVVSVTFGGVPAASYTVNSNSMITAVSPPDTSGVVDIVVTTTFTSSPTSPADQFMYPAPALSTPTLGQWASLALTGLIGVLGYAELRRRCASF